jgi:hypothetical protein
MSGHFHVPSAFISQGKESSVAIMHNTTFSNSEIVLVEGGKPTHLSNSLSAIFLVG